MIIVYTCVCIYIFICTYTHAYLGMAIATFRVSWAVTVYSLCMYMPYSVSENKGR